MEAHKKIKVECLQQAEALKLFLDKVGAETLDRHPDIRKLAETMAEECGGLSLALITIGRAMSSKKTPGEWKYAMKALRQSAASVFPGIGKKMFPQLKFSYDCLPDERVRSCFLYCCLFPSGFPIRKSELIHCWIGEGLLDHLVSSVRNQGEYILGSLIDACLLEDVRSDIVKMHDVIRDMALWIASESEKNKFCVKAGMQLKGQPVAENWEDVRRVSLMGNQIESLTQVFVCPNLLTLFLGKNELKVIINDFFNFMPMLKVLDLSFNINLDELPVGIAKLVSLEHLDLSYTGLKTLPVELKVLEKLKYLNIEHTSNLKTIPPQLISNVSKLQVLKMVGSGYEWLVEEVECLAYLNVLTISIESLSMLERAMMSLKLQSCNVEAVILKLLKGSRFLSISALANIQPLDFLGVYDCEDLEEVKIERAEIASAGWFRSVTLIKLARCPKLKDATWIFFVPHLVKMAIHECQDLEEVISEDKLSEDDKLTENSNLFSELEAFDLQKLPKLKTIYRDALPFPQLKEAIIKECPKLRKLPLNSESAEGQKIVIQGEEWWKNVEWEDECTRYHFLHSFHPIYL
ncbi:putative disease resistance protein [Hibiscus syriacus]|uniref:Disease resistance protein n=2 Tax=Hibiscus syriacus TaxID=106335 RepID=A0A6A2YLP6_HIBSY|nr:putative disease resistance protein [Hibiscus syriacus]